VASHDRSQLGGRRLECDSSVHEIDHRTRWYSVDAVGRRSKAGSGSDAVGYSKLDLGPSWTGQSDFSQAVLHISSTAAVIVLALSVAKLIRLSEFSLAANRFGRWTTRLLSLGMFFSSSVLRAGSRLVDSPMPGSDISLKCRSHYSS